jgi:hypothetical protein
MLQVLRSSFEAGTLAEEPLRTPLAFFIMRCSRLLLLPDALPMHPIIAGVGWSTIRSQLRAHALH